MNANEEVPRMNLHSCTVAPIPNRLLYRNEIKLLSSLINHSKSVQGEEKRDRRSTFVPSNEKRWLWCMLIYQLLSLLTFMLCKAVTF